MQEDEAIYTGSQDGYQWITMGPATRLFGVLDICPELLLNRFLAVTARDSGELRLSDTDRENGWRSRSGIAYSPKVSDVNSFKVRMDHRCCGFDEFYVFDEPQPDLGENYHGNPFDGLGPGKLFAIVNMPAFLLHNTNPTRDILNDIFWQQMEWVQPESYLSDGRDCTSLVTRNAEFFNTVRRYFSDETIRSNT